MAKHAPLPFPSFPFLSDSSAYMDQRDVFLQSSTSASRRRSPSRERVDDGVPGHEGVVRDAEEERERDVWLTVEGDAHSAGG